MRWAREQGAVCETGGNRQGEGGSTKMKEDMKDWELAKQGVPAGSNVSAGLVGEVRPGAGCGEIQASQGSSCTREGVSQGREAHPVSGGCVGGRAYQEDTRTSFARACTNIDTHALVTSAEGAARSVNGLVASSLSPNFRVALRPQGSDTQSST